MSTVDHLFFASILFRVCRVQCLFANTKIREMPFKKLLYFANRSAPVLLSFHFDRGIVCRH
jgi:hypothetical protein